MVYLCTRCETFRIALLSVHVTALRNVMLGR
jgi:hypothetical protein